MMTSRTRSEAIREQKRRQHVLANVTDPEKRKAFAQDTRRRNRPLKARAAEDRKQNRGDFHVGAREQGVRPRADGRPFLPPNAARALLIAALAVLGLDIGFAGTLGAVSFALPLTAAIAVGIVFMLAFTSAIKAMLSLFKDQLELTPAIARRRFFQLGVTLLVIWGAALFTGVAMIRPDAVDFAFGDAAFTVSLSTLTLVSPALGAVLLTSAELNAWAEPFVRSEQELEDLEAEIELTEALCSDVEAPEDQDGRDEDTVAQQAADGERHNSHKGMTPSIDGQASAQRHDNDRHDMPGAGLNGTRHEPHPGTSAHVS
jgi:hypothetical protein